MYKWELQLMSGHRNEVRSGCFSLEIIENDGYRAKVWNVSFGSIGFNTTESHEDSKIIKQ